MDNSKEIEAEIERLKSQFIGAAENELLIADALITQAAYETIYLRRLNEQAIVSGLVKIHPKHPTIQESLPVSKAITQHSATLTNIMIKLVKMLGTTAEDDDEGMSEYE